MFAYYLRLALASFRRNPGLTALMVFAIALGISVCMITLTSYRAAANNPAGERSSILFAASIDSWDPENPYEQYDKTLAPTMLTYRDAKALYESKIPDRKLIMYKAGGIVSRTDKGMEPEYIATRMTTADFFPMFEVPFKYGSAWDARADAGPEPVVVISKELNQKAFAGENSVGKSLVWHDRQFRVIGVLDDFEPLPKYYDVSNGSFSDMDGAYVPFAWGQVLELAAMAIPIAGRPRSSTASSPSSIPNASGFTAGSNCGPPRSSAPSANSSTTTSPSRRSTAAFRAR